jgi:hypothetical protein
MKEHEDNRLLRRQFLLASALAGGGLMLPTFAVAQNSMRMPMASATATPPVNTGPTEVSLRIGPVLVDVTKDKTISTIGYNGQVPGPLIRLQEASKFRYSYLMTLIPPSSSIGMDNSSRRKSMGPAKKRALWCRLVGKSAINSLQGRPGFVGCILM